MHLKPLKRIPLLMLLALSSAVAQAWTVDELAAALQAAARSEADKARDADRKPAEVLVFAGVQPGMTVLDVMAGGGWYTEVLSVAVGPDGTVYSENPAWLLEAMNGAPAKALSKRLADGRLPNVVRVDRGLEEGKIPPASIDIALTALNLHDTYDRFGRGAAVSQLRQIARTLKPDGVLILIDHAGLPDQDNARLHRIVPDLVREMVREAGFEIVAEGDMLRHPEDDKTKMVFAKGIRGKTDRFVLKLRPTR